MFHPSHALRHAAPVFALACALALSACNGGWEVEGPHSALDIGSEAATIDVGVNRVQMPIRDAIYAHGIVAGTRLRFVAIIASIEPNLCARLVKQTPTADANDIQYTFALEPNETRFYTEFATVDPNVDVDNHAYKVIDPCATPGASIAASYINFGFFAVSGAHVQNENWDTSSGNSSSAGSSSATSPDSSSVSSGVSSPNADVESSKVVNRQAEPDLIHNTFYLTGTGTVHVVMDGQTKLLQIETSLARHTAANTGAVSGSFTASPCEAWDKRND